MGVGQSLLNGASPDGENECYDDPAEPMRLVRGILSELGLPMELVLDIMELADYYPRVQFSTHNLLHVEAQPYRDEMAHSVARICLGSPPIPGPQEGEAWRVRRVAWMVESHDQGWGGDRPGTYFGHSWFDAVILRPIDPEDPHAPWDSGPDARFKNLEQYLGGQLIAPTIEKMFSRINQCGWDFVPTGPGEHDYTWRVQTNRVAHRDFERHTVEWYPGRTVDVDVVSATGCGDGAGFVDALRPGDVVALVMCAKYPGWSNTIQQRSVEVVYDVR